MAEADIFNEELNFQIVLHPSGKILKESEITKEN